jgi:sortase A
MKGWKRSGSRCVAALVVVGMALATAGCGGSGDANAGADAAQLPSESIDEAALVAPETTDGAVTSAPTTTEPSTTSAASTAPATTAPPTVVQTLPQPAPPPQPRADEPYVELGTLEIPKLGITQPLLEGITLNTLDRGPGHWPGTAMPGKLGNVVVAGHRTSHGKVFRNVDQLVPGDEVVLTTADGRFVYVVFETVIVQPDALYIIDQSAESTATLFACHPPGSTRQRIVVRMALQADTAVSG